MIDKFMGFPFTVKAAIVFLAMLYLTFWILIPPGAFVVTLFVGIIGSLARIFFYAVEGE